MEVTFLRHTRLDLEPGICYGQLDVPVGNSFREEADAISHQMHDSFDAVYSSPSQRCRDLAEFLIQKKNPPSSQSYPSDTSLGQIIPEPALMEMDFGDWEGKKWDDLSSPLLSRWMEDYVTIRPPNGESLEDFYRRVSVFLDSLRLLSEPEVEEEPKDEKRILCVTHAGVIRLTWAYVLGFPLRNIFKLPVAYGAMVRFRFHSNPDLDQVMV